MYILSNTAKHTLKLFISSIVCSVVFTCIINVEEVFSRKVVCMILLLASMLLFSYINIHILTGLFYSSDSALEYVIPVAVSFVLYICAASVLYCFRHTGGEISGIYNCLFLPTRFLEPMLRNEKISYTAAYILMAVISVIIPIYEGGFSYSDEF